MPSYSKVTKVGFVWSVLARGMNELVAIPTSMILARLLSPYDFGIAAVAGFFVQLANRLTNFGFNTALIQIKELTPQHATTIFIVNLTMAVTLWVILALSSSMLGHLFNSEEASRVIPIAALSFVLGSLGSVPSALMVRDLKFRDVAWLEGLSSWLTAIAGVAFAFAGFGYWSLIYSQVLAAAVQVPVRFFVAGWWPRLDFSSKVLQEMLSFGIGMHIKRLLDSVALNIDNLVIGWSLGLSALGFYDKAFTLMNRAVTGINSAGPVVSLRVFALIHEEQERFQNAYRKVLLISTFLAYPVFTALIFMAPALITVMFGQQWDLAVVPFQILCVAGCLKILNAYASTAIQSRGWIWGEVWRQCLYVALIAGGAAVGSRWSRLVGASAGVLVATIAMTVLMQTLLRRAAELRWRDVLLPQLPALVCSSGLAVLLALTSAVLRISHQETVPAWESMLAHSVVALAYGFLFIRLTWFAELRRIIDETVHEFAPRLAKVLPPAA